MVKLWIDDHWYPLLRLFSGLFTEQWRPVYWRNGGSERKLWVWQFFFRSIHKNKAFNRPVNTMLREIRPCGSHQASEMRATGRDREDFDQFSIIANSALVYRYVLSLLILQIRSSVIKMNKGVLLIMLIYFTRKWVLCSETASQVWPASLITSTECDVTRGNT